MRRLKDESGAPYLIMFEKDGGAVFWYIIKETPAGGFPVACGSRADISSARAAVARAARRAGLE